MKMLFIISALLLSINLYSQTVIVTDDSTFVEMGSYTKRTYSQFGFFLFLQAGATFNNFNSFKTALGEYNTDFINNNTTGLPLLGIGATYNKWLIELSWGLSHNNDYKNDSLNVKFNVFQYEIGFGYNLINTKRFFITPKTSINWNRYRLINSSKEKVHLEEYVSARNLDIRLNQLTGFLGLNMSYKFYKNYIIFPCDYWTVELFGGYIFQFNEKPWVYSSGKRLINDNKIDLKNYSLGLRFSFYIE